MISISFRAINRYLAITSSIKIKILHKFCTKNVCESKLCKVDVWVPEKGWKVIDACLREYCKNFYMLGKRSSRIGMRGKIFLAAKYWCRVGHLKKNETARQYYDWQENGIEN
jgi:hypothetical protein